MIPMSHQYLVTSRSASRGRASALPTLRDPDLLVYYREDGDGLVMGGYERDSRAGLPARRDRRASTRSRPTSTAACSRRTGTASRRSPRTRSAACPAMDEVKITKLINGPEAFTPDNEFCLGETEVAGFFVAAGFCAHGLAGAGGIGKVIAEWIAEGEPSLDLWEMDVRRFGAQYRSPAYTHARIQRDLRDLLRHPLPQPRARGGPAAAGLGRQRLARASTAPPSARSRAGSGSTGTSRTPPPATSRCARAAGRASTGRRRSAPSTAPRARRWRSSTSPRSRRWRSRARARRRSLEGLCDNRGRAASVGQITYTQMLNRRGGIECDFTVARLGEELLLDRHRDRVRQPRPRVDPQATCPSDGCGRRSATSPRPGRASGSGGRGPARCCSR